MTQEQLADATALTAVHVNRVLQVIQREGLGCWDFNPRYLHTRELAL